MTDEGLYNLVAATIRLAAQDLRYGNEEIRKDTIEFLESEWFVFICSEMCLNPRKVKKMMVTHSICTRDTYEGTLWLE